MEIQSIRASVPTLARVGKANARVSSLRGAFEVLLGWCLAVGTFAALIVADYHWAMCIAAIFLLSKAQNFIMYQGHEALHWVLLHNRRWNDIVGEYLCLAPMGIGFRRARLSHFDHHRHLSTTSDEEIDLHMIRNMTRVGYLRHLFTPLVGEYLYNRILPVLTKRPVGLARVKYKLAPEERRADLRGIVIAGFVLAGVLVLIDWRLCLFWGGSLLTVAAFFHKAKAFCDHARLPGEPEDALFSYHPSLLDRMFFGTQQAHHAEHHLHTAVPYYNLKNLEEVASQSAKVISRGSYFGFLVKFYLSLEK